MVPDAPVIEWCTIHIGHDTVREEWEKGVDALREVLENTAADKGYRGLGAGWSLESDREFIVMIGWETKEAHTSWKAGLDADLAEKGMVLFRKGAKSVKIVHIKIEGEVTEVANGNKDEESAEQAEIEGGPAITA